MTCVPMRAVLFDFGDTLFHRAKGHLAIVEEAARLGAAVDEPAAAALWGHIHAQARCQSELEKGRDLSAERHRQCWLAIYRPAEQVAHGLAEALYALEASARGWAPYTDTVSTVAALARAGTCIGVVSDTGWDIRTVFRRFGLDELIGTYVLSGEVGVAKPSPLLFETACDRLSVAPEEALMVGDNATTDGGAVAVGIPTYLLPPAAPGRARGLDAIIELVRARSCPAPT